MLPKPHVIKPQLTIQDGTWRYLPVNMQMTIERIQVILPDWSERVISIDELYALAEAHDILVLQTKLEAMYGITCWFEGGICIVLNSANTQDANIVVLAHELVHALTHAPCPRYVKTFQPINSLHNMRKYEQQSDFVGLLALLPKCKVAGRSVNELLDRYDIPREWIKKRMGFNF
jgi:Zn-dependent peptidase ImmA (M78 family)